MPLPKYVFLWAKQVDTLVSLNVLFAQSISACFIHFTFNYMVVQNAFYGNAVCEMFS